MPCFAKTELLQYKGGCPRFPLFNCITLDMFSSHIIFLPRTLIFIDLQWTFFLLILLLPYTCQRLCGMVVKCIDSEVCLGLKPSSCKKEQCVYLCQVPRTASGTQ